MNNNHDLINVGFIGNLNRACINWGLVSDLIENKNCHFHFVGNNEISDLNFSAFSSSVLDQAANRKKCKSLW